MRGIHYQMTFFCLTSVNSLVKRYKSLNILRFLKGHACYSTLHVLVCPSSMLK